MKKTMGEVIATNRKAKGMTQLQLAEIMGVTDKAVSKWERDLSCPDIGSLPLLSETLGISIEELMQVKAAAEAPSGKSATEIADIAFKGVGLAMGIAVTVLTILGELKAEDGMIMLGIGVACIAISLLGGKK